MCVCVFARARATLCVCATVCACVCVCMCVRARACVRVHVCWYVAVPFHRYFSQVRVAGSAYRAFNVLISIVAVPAPPLTSKTAPQSDRPQTLQPASRSLINHSPSNAKQAPY